jgi:drug/metabolite transporter (DMT)-like permease
VIIYLVIFITLIAALIASASQLLFKKRLNIKVHGMMHLIRTVLNDRRILAGLAGYGISFIIYIYALSKAPLSVVYPVFASSFIFIAILSYKFLNERISPARVVGILIIFIGIVAIALSYH